VSSFKHWGTEGSGYELLSHSQAARTPLSRITEGVRNTPGPFPTPSRYYLAMTNGRVSRLTVPSEVMALT